VKRYVVVGNGPAGVNCIEAIREVDPKSEIINVSEEPYPPYSRPLLSYLVAGKVPEERVYFRPNSFYQDHRVRAILGDKAQRLDTRDRVLLLASGQRVEYDKLLIATGRSSGALRIAGLDGKGVFHLNSLEHARGVVAELPNVKHALVIGSGLIGLKSAEALRTAGKDVTVVEIEPRVLPLAVDPRASEILEDVLRANGVDLKLGMRVEAILRDASGAVVGARLDGGEELEAQLVINAAGLTPNVDFLSGTAVRINVGVIVDHFLETTEPGVFAAGDVSEPRDVITGRSNLSAVWPRASEQGRCSGLNMIGIRKEYAGGYGMNSVAFFGLSCITLGDVLTEKADFEIFVKEIPDEKVYFKVILENNVVRGAVQVGKILNVSAMNRLLRKRVDVRGFKENLLEEKFVFAY
jgi:NAD(P)H-nitrite reductase large subunit